MTLTKSNYNRLNQATAQLCDVITDAVGDGNRSDDTVTLGTLDILALERIRNVLENFIVMARAH